jgi:hypothetical protein
LAYTHPAYAVAASKGIINEPIFLGRKWGVGFMWTEVVIYSALGLGSAYRGWFSGDGEVRARADRAH